MTVFFFLIVKLKKILLREGFEPPLFSIIIRLLYQLSYLSTLD